MGKPTEATAVEVYDQGLVRCYEDVKAHIELFTPNQEWVHNVFLDNVRLSLRCLCFPPEVVLPLGDLLQLVQ